MILLYMTSYSKTLDQLLLKQQNTIVVTVEALHEQSQNNFLS